MNGLEAFKEIRENTTLTEVEFYFEGCHTEVEVVEKELKASAVVGKYLDISFERTSAGKPVMFVRNKRLGQGWLIHISEEEFNSLKGESK